MIVQTPANLTESLPEGMHGPACPVAVPHLGNGQAQPDLRCIGPNTPQPVEQMLEAQDAQLVEDFPMNLEFLPSDRPLRIDPTPPPQLIEVGLVGFLDFEGLVVQPAADVAAHADAVAGELADAGMGIEATGPRDPSHPGKGFHVVIALEIDKDIDPAQAGSLGIAEAVHDLDKAASRSALNCFISSSSMNPLSMAPAMAPSLT